MTISYFILVIVIIYGGCFLLGMRLGVIAANALNRAGGAGEKAGIVAIWFLSCLALSYSWVHKMMEWML
jgi:hypothetical protein